MTDHTTQGTAGLLPCPFCGEEPVFPPASEVFGSCYDCGCADCGIASMSIQIIDCFDHPREHVHASWDNVNHRYGDEFIEVARNQAIEQWNARPVSAKPAPVEVVLDLREWDDTELGLYVKNALESSTSIDQCGRVMRRFISSMYPRPAPELVVADAVKFEELLNTVRLKEFECGMAYAKKVPEPEAEVLNSAADKAVEALRAYFKASRSPVQEGAQGVEPYAYAVEDVKFKQPPTLVFADRIGDYSIILSQPDRYKATPLYVAPSQAIPEELFDGFAVLKQIDEGKHVSADHVAVVLDAVVGLIRERLREQ